MPLVRTALIATAACLIGAAAYAQPAPGDNTAPAGDNQSMPQTSQSGNPAGPASTSDMNGGASMNGSSGMNAAPIGAAANTSATVTTNADGVQVIASQPVPDTPRDRQLYGQPLSRAGKRTAPTGD